MPKKLLDKYEIRDEVRYLDGFSPDFWSAFNFNTILPKIMAELTGKSRYQVIAGRDFEWSSKSWTHNAFRLYELIFWRKQGIRAESTTGVDENGVSWVIAHSFEAAIAYTETFIRSAFALPKFKFVKVYVPQLALAGFGGVPTRTPYLFAIAYDANYRGTGTGGASSVTFSHTCTGSNLTLTVMGCENTETPATSSSATYNAVSMTQVATNRNTSQNTWSDINALAAPATGANNVVWTANDTEVSAFAISLSGTAASPIGASASSQWIGQTSKSQAVTTTAANSVLVDNTQNNNASASATGSGQTIRNNATGVGGNRFYGSTMTTTTTGSYSLGYSWSGNTDGTIIVAEIKENVATNVTVDATVLAATFSIIAAAISGGASIAASVLTATFSVQSATEIIDEYYTPPQPLTATFSIPTVEVITPDAQVSPSVVSASFSTPAPSVSGDAPIAIGAPLAATFGTQAPTFQGDVAPVPSVLSATFSTPAPVVTGIENVSIAASVLEATFSLQSPTVSAEQNASFAAGVLSATFTLQTPTVTAIQNVDLTATTLVATFSVQSPRRVGGVWTAQPRVNGDAEWTPQPRAV